MEIKFNSTFKLLLEKFNLSTDLDFKFDLPIEVQQMLSDKIIVNEFGLGLESNWKPSPYAHPDEQCFHEDNQNHFHVDWYIKDISNENAFGIGVKTLIDFAKRFKNEKIENIQLTYSLQTPEMGCALAKMINIDDDEHSISDGLSFHTKRTGQIVVDGDLFNNEYYAFLTIDI